VEAHVEQLKSQKKEQIIANKSGDNINQQAWVDWNKWYWKTNSFWLQVNQQTPRVPHWDLPGTPATHGLVIHSPHGRSHPRPQWWETRHQ
jgi:hypothetical protein